MLTKIVFISAIFGTFFSNKVEVEDHLRTDFLKVTEDYIFYYDFNMLTLFYHDRLTNEVNKHRFSQGEGPGEIQQMISGLYYNYESKQLMVTAPHNGKVMVFSMPDMEFIEENTKYGSSLISSPYYSDGFYFFSVGFPLGTFFKMCEINDVISNVDAEDDCNEYIVELDDEIEIDKLSRTKISHQSLISEDKLIYFHKKMPKIVEFKKGDGRNSNTIVYRDDLLPDKVYEGDDFWVDTKMRSSGFAYIDSEYYLSIYDYTAIFNNRSITDSNQKTLYKLAKNGDQFDLKVFKEYDKYILGVAQHENSIYVMLSEDDTYTINAEIKSIEIE